MPNPVYTKPTNISFLPVHHAASCPAATLQGCKHLKQTHTYDGAIAQSTQGHTVIGPIAVPFEEAFYMFLLRVLSATGNYNMLEGTRLFVLLSHLGCLMAVRKH